MVFSPAGTIKAGSLGLILLTSNPSGARIILEGDSVKGKMTPNVLRKLSPGTYTVGLSKTGYQLWTKTVVLKSGDEVIINARLIRSRGKAKTPIASRSKRKAKPRRIAARRKKGATKPRHRKITRARKVQPPKRPAKGKLSLYSKPKGARIYVNGRLRGVTDDWVKLSLGKKYRIVLKKKGYHEVRQRVLFNRTGQKVSMVLKRKPPSPVVSVVKRSPKTEVEPKKTDLKSPEPKLTPPPRKAPGFLSVNAQPWGEVYINGKKVADQTPLFKWRLKAGRHKVQIYWPSLHKFSRPRMVTIKPLKVESHFFRY